MQVAQIAVILERRSAEDDLFVRIDGLGREQGIMQYIRAISILFQGGSDGMGELAFK
jgi:hypothetical protein